jgi:Tfp pilus assembly protein PilZ
MICVRRDRALSHRDQRKDPRYPLRISATLIRGKEETLLVTDDVSRHGVFLRTIDPPKLRQLVKLVLQLPPNRELVTFHGMAVHVVAPGAARVPGVGVQFYSADLAQRAKWERFIRGVAEGRIKQEKLAVKAEPAKTKQRPAQRAAKIRLWVKSIEQLQQIFDENIAKGGLLLATDEPIPVGSAMHVVIMHPISKRSFDLEGVVRRAVERHGFKGIAIELANMDQAERERFMDFTSSAVDVELSIDIPSASG